MLDALIADGDGQYARRHKYSAPHLMVVIRRELRHVADCRLL